MHNYMVGIGIFDRVLCLAILWVLDNLCLGCNVKSTIGLRFSADRSVEPVVGHFRMSYSSKNLITLHSFVAIGLNM